MVRSGEPVTSKAIESSALDDPVEVGRPDSPTLALREQLEDSEKKRLELEAGVERLQREDRDLREIMAELRTLREDRQEFQARERSRLIAEIEPLFIQEMADPLARTTPRKIPSKNPCPISRIQAYIAYLLGR